jgi:hypothetical protein
VTSVPKFPSRPSADAREMMQVRGNASNGTAIVLQIFSDGQAPFISNGESTFLMHTGNGIFVDQDNTIILDEKNKQLSINNVIVKDIRFTMYFVPNTTIDSSKEAAAICAAYHNFWYLMSYKSKAGYDMMFSDRVQKNLDAQYSGDQEYRDIRSKMFSQLATINMGNPSQSQIEYVRAAAAFCVKIGQPIGQMTGT